MEMKPHKQSTTINKVKKYLCLVFVLIMTSLPMASQSKIIIDNKSFEGTPSRGEMPFELDGWIDIGYFNFPKETPPDIFPGNFWRNNTFPSHGNSCVGLVVRDNDSYEAIAQQLHSRLKADTCYQFTIDLCRSDSYFSRSRITGLEQNYIRTAVFRIWGSNYAYSKNELLASSEGIDHVNWKTYQFELRPKKDFKYIIIEAFWKEPYNNTYCGHIMIDNMSDLEVIECTY